MEKTKLEENPDYTTTKEETKEITLLLYVNKIIKQEENLEKDYLD